MQGSRRQVSDGTMALLVLALCFAMNMAGRGIADTYVAFLLPLEEGFGWSRTAIASVYSVYMLSNGLSAPFAGLLFDRFGPRMVYAFGLFVMGGAYVLAGTLTELWQLYLLVGFAGGIGISALGMVPSTALISRWFRHRTGTAIGLAYAGFGAGSLVMVPLAQYLIDWQGWRVAYYTLGGILLFGLPCILVMPWKRMGGGPKGYVPPIARPGEVETGLAPLFAAMRTRAFWSLAQVFFFTAFTVYLILVQTIVFLVDAGFGALEAATAFGAAGMLSVIGVSTAGWLVDRYGARSTVTLSFLLTFIGIVLLFYLSSEPAIWALSLYVVTFGLAQGARGPIVSTIAARVFPGRAQATIYGTIYACMSLGAATGAYLSGFLYDLSGSYRLGFSVAMVGVFLAVAPFWWTTSISQQPSRSAT